MAGYNVGTVTVTVEPSLKDFHEKLRRQVAKITSVEVPVGADLDKFSREVKTAAEKASRSAEAEIPVDADTTKARRKIEGLGDERVAPDVDPDTTNAKRKIAGLGKNAVRLPVEANIAKAASAIASLGRGRRVGVDVDADTAGAEAEIARVERTRRVLVVVDAVGAKGLSSLLSLSGTLSKFAMIAGSATVALAGTAPAVAAIGSAATSALTPVVALAGALAVPALAGAAMAFGVLKASMDGLASQLSEVQAAYGEVSTAASEAFLGQANNLGQLVAIMGPLRSAMTGLATDMGRATHELVGFVSQGVGLDAMRTLLHNSGVATGQLSYALSSAVQGVVAVGAAASPVLSELARGIHAAADAWRDRMVAGLQDGSLEQYFRDAVTVAQQLGYWMGQVGGIISGVWAAMAAAGGGVVATIGEAVEATNRWVNSAAGMETMAQFFTVMQDAVAALMPVLGQLAQIIITQLAPIMSEVIQTLAPYAEMVLTNISAALETLAPAIPEVAESFAQLATAVSFVLRVLSPVIRDLGLLSPILVPLGAVVMGVATAFRAWAFIQTILPALKLVGTVVSFLGGVLKTVLLTGINAVTFALRALFATMMANPIVAVIAAIVAIGVALWAFFTKTELGRQMWASFMEWLSGVWQTVQAAWTIAWAAITAGWNAFWNGLVLVVTTVGTAISTAWQWVTSTISAIFTGFIEGVRWVWDAFWNGLSIIVTTVGTAISTAWSAAVAWITGIFTAFTAGVSALWTGFWSGLLAVASAIGSGISAAWSALWSGVRAVFSAVVNFVKSAWQSAASVLTSVAQQIWNAVSSAFNSMRSAVVSTVSSMWNATKSAFSSGVSAVVSFVSSLPGRIRGIFSGAGSWLVSAGRNILQGLLNGISSMVGAVMGKIRSIGSSIKSAFAGIMGIRSPSRVFMGYGQNLVEGLAIGVEDNVSVATSSATTLASAADTALDKALPKRKVVSPKVTADMSNARVRGNVAAAPAVMAKQLQKAHRGVIAPAARGISQAMQQMSGAVASATLGKAAPSMLQLADATAQAGDVVQSAASRRMAPAFGAAGRSIADTARGQIEPAMRETRSSVAHTAASFGPAVSMIGAQWSQVQPATAAPVRFVINTVFNDGLVGMWNGVSDLLGVKKMAPFVARFATGGYVSGPGGPTDDKIPALLSNGEYVIKASTVRALGVGTLDQINNGGSRFGGAFTGRQRDAVMSDANFHRVAVRRQGGGIAEGTPAWRSLKRGYDWARSRNGRPYVWGGSANGAGGADCCLVAGTMVYGPNGAKPIAELSAGDLVYSFVDGRRTVERVNAAWFSKRQDVYRVRTRNRAVVASDNHPFLRLVQVDAGSGSIPSTWDVEWARTDELRPGDLLVAPKALELDESFENCLPSGRSISEQEAWLLGLIVGDGSVMEKSVRICVYGDIRDYAANVMEEMGLTSAKFTESNGVEAWGSAIVRELSEAGFKGRAVDKRIPECVWGWQPSHQRAFLNGYCDADGHYPANPVRHGERTYASASRALIEDVRALHVTLGDAVSNISMHSREGKEIVIKGHVVKNPRPLFTFAVWREGARDGTVAICHNSGIRRWISEGDFTVTKLLSVTHEGVEDTYDIEVDGAHNFIADGVVVHNSGFMSGIADVILGGSGVRQWATMSFPGTQRGAWKPGLAAGFSVGIWNGGPYGGHTAGSIGGVEGMPMRNVEAGGVRSRVKFGTPDAAGAADRQFTHRYYMVHVDGGGFVGARAGGDSVVDMVKDATDSKRKKLLARVDAFPQAGLIGGLPAAATGKMLAAFDAKVKAAETGSGGSGGDIPAGSGVERWAPMAKRALARVGFEPNERNVRLMLAQIRSESGGDHTVAQRIRDINGTGESAGVGLLQIIPGTFAAYRDPGLPNNRRDPFANMVAALRYYKARYGMDLGRMWGRGHGYDQGGWLAPGVQTVYNGFRKPEAVLSPSESEAFVGVARRFVDDDRAGSQFVGQHVENQYVVDPDELSWRTERSVKRAMRLEGIRA